jgi:hypothetical protein
VEAEPIDPGVKKPANAAKRAVAAMLLLLALAGFAILFLSSPAAREVHVSGELEKFPLPAEVEFEMPEVSALHMRRLDMDFSRVADFSVFVNGVKKAIPGITAVSVRDDNSGAGSSSSLHQIPRKGAVTVTAPEGTSFEAVAGPGGSALAVRFLPKPEKPVHVTVEAEGIELTEANRVIVRSVAPKAETIATGDTSFELGNKADLVHMESNCRECRLDLTSATQLPALSESSADGLPQTGAITLHNIRILSATLHGVKDSEAILTIPTEMDIVPGKDFKWTSIMAVNGKSPCIQVSGRGDVKSMKQDGREVLPSRAAELLAADPAHRGLYGGCALFLAFAWGVLFNRSLDLLAKRILPE